MPVCYLLGEWPLSISAACSLRVIPPGRSLHPEKPMNFSMTGISVSGFSLCHLVRRIDGRVNRPTKPSLAVPIEFSAVRHTRLLFYMLRC